MHVREYGRGERAVVLLHGMPGPSDDFVALAEALAQTHRVLLPDLPGYGASPPLVPYDWDRAQRALEELLHARGLVEVATVGHSAGCYRAMRLALDKRVRVTRIACLGATAGPAEDGREMLRNSARAVRAGADFGDMFVTRFLAERFRGDVDMVAKVKAWANAAPAEVVASELETYASLEHLRSHFQELTMPVLLRVGELDVATPPSLSETFARSLPDARVEVVPGCGHALLMEDEAATIAALRSFLTE